MYVTTYHRANTLTKNKNLTEGTGEKSICALAVLKCWPKNVFLYRDPMVTVSAAGPSHSLAYAQAFSPMWSM